MRDLWQEYRTAFLVFDAEPTIAKKEEALHRWSAFLDGTAEMDDLDKITLKDHPFAGLAATAHGQEALQRAANRAWAAFFIEHLIQAGHRPSMATQEKAFG